MVLSIMEGRLLIVCRVVCDIPRWIQRKRLKGDKRSFGFLISINCLNKGRNKRSGRSESADGFDVREHLS